MRTLTLLALVLVAAVASSTQAASSRRSAPPPGLTQYGRVVWNLDALLHDTFGRRQVYFNYPRGGLLGSYSTRFLDMARSIPYTYTFANARGSEFRAVSPTHPPKIGRYAFGENAPIRIGGAYISCGHGKWLYEREGQAMFDGNTWCSTSPLHP